MLAVLLQSGTYVTQGIVWRVLARAMGHPLAAGKAFSLGLAMLFVDQALPSGGASGVAMVSGALSRMGMPRAVVASIVLMDVAMYYLAYASCMTVALGVALYHGYLPGWVNVAMLLFVFAGLGVTWFVTALPGGGMGGLKTWLRRFAKLARLLDTVDQARPESFRQKRVMFQAFVYPRRDLPAGCCDDLGGGARTGRDRLAGWRVCQFHGFHVVPDHRHHAGRSGNV